MSRRKKRGKRKGKGRGDQFVVYGHYPVREALERAPEEALGGAAVLIAESRGPGVEEVQRAAANRGVRCQRVDVSELDRSTDGANHQGMALILRTFPWTDFETVLEWAADDPRARVVVLDQIQDPGNLGAIVRSAVAFGASGIITTRDRTAPMTSAAVKTSAGAAFRIPMTRVTNLSRTLDALREAGFWIYGAAGDDGTVTPGEVDWDRRTAFVLGSEGSGLRRLTREKCDVLVRIPQTDLVESLNVSVAAGVLLYAAWPNAATE